MTDNTTAKVAVAEAAGATRSVRNFRNATDIETFYRFVHDNELRREAKLVLDFIISKLKKPGRRSRKIQ